MRIKRIVSVFAAIAALSVVGMGTTVGLSTADQAHVASNSCRPTLGGC
jgi:hypothetical protein